MNLIYTKLHDTNIETYLNLLIDLKQKDKALKSIQLFKKDKPL